MACLKKVHGMASDGVALYESALKKLAEFRELQYPKAVLRGVCTYMAAVTGQYVWIQIRQEVTANW